MVELEVCRGRFSSCGVGDTSGPDGGGQAAPWRSVLFSHQPSLLYTAVCQIFTDEDHEEDYNADGSMSDALGLVFRRSLPSKIIFVVYSPSSIPFSC